MKFFTRVYNKIYHFILGLNRMNKQKFFYEYEIHKKFKNSLNNDKKNILVIGIYLTDYSNNTNHLVKQFNNSKIHHVDQKWIAIGKQNIPEQLKDLTVFHSKEKIPKFKLLNMIIDDIDISQYDYLIITDDDIVVHDAFIDVYIDSLEKYDLKLAQPSRTRFSYNAHPIVLQKKNTSARITNFVEIGPIFSFHKSIYKDVLPFPTEAEMGWGLDFIWPKIGEKNNFNLGIVDLIAVDHSYRPQSKTYSNDQNRVLMENLLKKHDNNFHEEKVILKRIV